MADPIENDVEPRLGAPGDPAVRVVLAEADAPGSLHYLLEAEGFQVVGCAADEHELGRVLGQDLEPDVIVLDADITATSLLVARELAPEAHVIAVWPDDVLPPPGGDRVSPRLVYEELGPAIRRHMDARVVPVVHVPDVVMPSAELAAVGAAATGGSSFALGRAASRLSVTSVTLLTAILLTMGVSFALGGFGSGRTDVPPRIVAPRTSTGGGGEVSDPITGRAPRIDGSGDPTHGPSDGPSGPSGHHGDTGGQLAPAPNTGGDGNTGGDPGTTPTDPGTPADQGGGSGDQSGGGSGGQGDQGAGSGGQGNQGGGSGGQGDQGGGSGGQGNQGDQGGN
jgi:hypothetical protein